MQTLDLTAALSPGGTHVLALQAMHQNGPSVIFEVSFRVQRFVVFVVQGRV